MIISELIKTTREEQGLTRYRLAKIAGVTESAVTLWENGQRSITVKNADKVFKALGAKLCIGAKNGKESEYDGG